MRPGFWNSRMRRDQNPGLIRTNWRNFFALVFLFLACAVVPLHGQNDLAFQASELMRAGKFHDAELLWRQLAQRHPKDAVIRGNLGVTLAQQGKLEPATVFLGRVTFVAPADITVALPNGAWGIIARRLAKDAAVGDAIAVTIAALDVDEGRLVLQPARRESPRVSEGPLPSSVGAAV